MTEGSIPSAGFLYSSHSSSWPGHCFLKAETGVQISYGILMPHIIYHKVEDGTWLKQSFIDQCDFKFLIRGSRCQGAAGHDGDHWFYRLDGSYAWRIQEECHEHDYTSIGGWSQPGHANYVSPIDKKNDFYLNHHTTENVTDEVLIDRLENFDDHEWPEDVSMTRPV